MKRLVARSVLHFDEFGVKKRVQHCVLDKSAVVTKIKTEKVEMMISSKDDIYVNTIQ